jgi:hypothetical protein
MQQDFWQKYVLPSVQNHISALAKNGDAARGQINLQPIREQQFLWEIANAGNIPLNKDHDPWISQVTASIDPSTQALELFLDSQANVTFLEIHVNAWASTWLQLKVDGQQNISLAQVKEEQNHTTSLTWWKWLIAVVLGPVPLITTAIIEAVVSDDVPDLKKNFASVSTNLVKWGNQKTGGFEEYHDAEPCCFQC